MFNTVRGAKVAGCVSPKGEKGIRLVGVTVSNFEAPVREDTGLTPPSGQC